MEVSHKPISTIYELSKSSSLCSIKFYFPYVFVIPSFIDVLNIQPRHALLLRQCFRRCKFTRWESYWNLCRSWCFYLARMALHFIFLNRLLVYKANACFIYCYSCFGTYLLFLLQYAFLLEWRYLYVWIWCLCLFNFFKNYFLNLN